MTVKIDGPRGRSLQTQEQLQESCLTAARRPDYRNKAAGLYVEIDVLQDELVGDTIAKREVAHFDGTFHFQASHTGSFGFGDGGDDVGQPVEVQTKQTKLHELIDEAHGAIIEGLAKRQECEQHADREPLAGKDQAGSEIDDDDVDQTGQESSE